MQDSKTGEFYRPLYFLVLKAPVVWCYWFCNYLLYWHLWNFPKDEKMDTTPISTRAQVAPSPLIPQPVERFRATPCVSVTPASPVPNGAVAETAPPHSVLHPSHKPHPARPTDLDLGAPKRPMRHLRPPQADAPPVPAGSYLLETRRATNRFWLCGVSNKYISSWCNHTCKFLNVANILIWLHQ